MEKKVIVEWSDDAIEELQQIHDYLAIFSKSKASRTVEEVLKKVEILATGFVKIGQIEPLLVNEPLEYRYLIIENYKIIYRIIKSEIEIVKVFDVRQDPSKLKF